MKKGLLAILIIGAFTITGCGNSYDGPTYLKCTDTYSSFDIEKEEIEFFFSEDGKSRTKIIDTTTYTEKYSEKFENFNKVFQECKEKKDETDWDCEVDRNSNNQIIKIVTYTRTEEVSYEEQKEAYKNLDCE